MTGAPAPPPRVVVVGAGIAGLAAALRIVEGPPPLAGTRGAGQSGPGSGRAEVVVCEAGPRAGGVIATERTGEYVVEAGPDSFLTEKPEVLRLCDRLGLADRLIGIQPGASRTYIVLRGGLVPLPDGFRLIAPTRFTPWLLSPLFSWPGKIRMAMDCVLPPRRSAADESVASFVIRRFGREAFDRVAQPMIGTIYTADATRVSLAATMPRLAEIERRYGSVIRGLARLHRAMQAPPPDEAPGVSEIGRRLGLFATFSDGMQALVEAAVARLPAGTLRLRTQVTAVACGSGRHPYVLTLGGGGTLEADAVIIATPAGPAARLLEVLDGDLASRLGNITYASSASVTVAYRRGDVRHPLDGLGFVVPRIERRPILAASFSSVKFAGRAPVDRALVRVFLGGALAPDAAALDDDRLLAVVRGETAALLGVTAAPQMTRVVHHHEAMPQYGVGHLERVAQIEARAAAHEGLALAGAAYRGVGISDCIRSGEAAADRVLAIILARTAGDRARRAARPRPD